MKNCTDTPTFLQITNIMLHRTSFSFIIYFWLLIFQTDGRAIIVPGIVRGSLDVEPLNWLAVIFSGCQWMELPKQWMSVDVSGWQWMSVDWTSYQMIVSGCQWMAVDGSGWQWICNCHLCNISVCQWMCNCHLCNSSRPTACRLVVTATSYKVGTSYINKATDKCSLQKCSCGSWRELQHNILIISWSVCMNTPYWSLVSFSRTQLPRSKIQKFSAC